MTKRTSYANHKLAAAACLVPETAWTVIIALKVVETGRLWICPQQAKACSGAVYVSWLLQFFGYHTGIIAYRCRNEMLIWMRLLKCPSC